MTMKPLTKEQEVLFRRSWETGIAYLASIGKLETEGTPEEIVRKNYQTLLELQLDPELRRRIERGEE